VDSPGKKCSQVLSKEATGPYKAPNIGPKGPTPAIFKPESRSFYAVHGNKIYPVCVSVGRSGSIDIGFKYALNKFTVKYIPTLIMTAVINVIIMLYSVN
jgi:hypothetical protein